MPTYDEELLIAARRLLSRRGGQRGQIPSARIRRSISTSYYALFHFLTEESGSRLLGTHNDLRRRRRILARVFTHAGIKVAMDKVRSSTIDPSVEEFMRLPSTPPGPMASPVFMQTLAKVFLDAQAKRHDADYDMNKPLSETDARLLRQRVLRVIAGWRGATLAADRDVKHALCMLMLLRGQLRKEN